MCKITQAITEEIIEVDLYSKFTQTERIKKVINKMTETERMEILNGLKYLKYVAYCSMSNCKKQMLKYKKENYGTEN